VEQYPHLLVHGPLQATLLLHHLHTHLSTSTPSQSGLGMRIHSFEYKATAPLLCQTNFTLEASVLPSSAYCLRIVDDKNVTTMEGTARVH